MEKLMRIVAGTATEGLSRLVTETSMGMPAVVLSRMTNGAFTAALAGLVCGVLSGMGIGGGTLLMVWMTAVAGMEQNGARGINLLYFLPVAVVSLYFHRKNGLLSKKVILPAAMMGCVTAALTGWLARDMDTGLLGKLFGAFLLFVGVKELLYRDRKAK